MFSVKNVKKEAQVTTFPMIIQVENGRLKSSCCFQEVQEISFVDIILVVPEIFCVQTISFTALPVLEILTV